DGPGRDRDRGGCQRRRHVRLGDRPSRRRRRAGDPDGAPVPDHKAGRRSPRRADDARPLAARLLPRRVGRAGHGRVRAIPGAEWIVEGLPGCDFWEMDSRRFGAHYASREYTLARTHEIYSTYYDVKYPGHEREAGRPLRVSPTYERLRELGAVFGEKSGWERA